MNIASLNIRSLVGKERLCELEDAVATAKWETDILGLSEVKRYGNRIVVTKNGDLLCY